MKRYTILPPTKVSLMKTPIHVWFELYDVPTVCWDRGRLSSSNLPASVAPMLERCRRRIDKQESVLSQGLRLTDLFYAWIRPASPQGFSEKEKEFIKKLGYLISRNRIRVFARFDTPECVLLVSKYGLADFAVFRRDLVQKAEGLNAQLEVSTVGDLAKFLGCRS